MSTFEDTHDRGLLNSVDLKRRLTGACVWSTSLADLERLPIEKLHNAACHRRSLFLHHAGTAMDRQKMVSVRDLGSYP